MSDAAAGGTSVPGRLITFEGGEGTGKSTQVEHLAAALRRVGIDPLVTREPGGTPGAEAIRGLLLQGAPERWLPLTEVLLLLAARHDHVVRRIAPALAAGRWVLCDRFMDSTRVYQGIAGAADEPLIEHLHETVFGELRPDLTLVFDLPVEEGLARRRRAGGDHRYERMDRAFHERVRAGFLAVARAEPARCVVIDSSQSAEQVANAVAAVMADRFGLPLEPATPAS